MNLYIETKSLIIRSYKEDDLMECYQLMQDKELFAYMDMHVMTIEEYKGLFKSLINSYDVCFDKDFKYSG